MSCLCFVFCDNDVRIKTFKVTCFLVCLYYYIILCSGLLGVNVVVVCFLGGVVCVCVGGGGWN